jgi:hypothetical protein
MLSSIKISTSGLAQLADPQLMRRAETLMIERAVEITEPMARSEAPSRTGMGKSFIIGIVDQHGPHPIGRIYPTGKGFYLRILSTGARAHEIRPVRFRSQRKSKAAMRAQGPGRARGALSALRFTIGGQMLFRPFAMIPALRPNPFLERAAVRATPAIAAESDRAMQQTLDAASTASLGVLAAG